MPFTKVWNGAGSGATAGDYEDSRNWELISLRTSAWSWTASGSGTNEYYLRTAANGDPGFAASPPSSNGVYINGSAATEGTAGSLTAGQWDYADNDTLGYSTIYVRLSGGGDPDAQDADHVQFRQIPQAGEHVRIPAGSSSISSNLDQSAVAIGDFIREEGHEGSIGSSTGYLRIDPDRFEHNGNAQAFIDIGSANISPQIYGTAAPSVGERGLYLRGSNISVLNIMGGDVGLASLAGETSTVTTVRILAGAAGGGGFVAGGGGAAGASIWIGNGVTLTNLHQSGGDVKLRCGASAVILYDGLLTTEENGAMTTVTQYGGEFVWRSTANVTTYNIHGGTLDMSQSGATRTLSTLNKYRGAYVIRHNKEAVTITTETRQETFNESIGA